MAALVADGGETHSVFSRLTDGRYPHGRIPQLGSNQSLRLARTFSLQMSCLSDVDLFIIDEDVNHRRGFAGDHQSVNSDALQFESEMAGGQRIRYETSEWRFGNDGELGGGGEAGPNQGSAGKD